MIRLLAALFAADVAGYSRLMGRDEEGTHAALMAFRREIVESKNRRASWPHLQDYRRWPPGGVRERRRCGALLSSKVRCAKPAARARYPARLRRVGKSVANPVHPQRPGDIFEALLAHVFEYDAGRSRTCSRTTWLTADPARLGQRFEAGGDSDAGALDVVGFDDDVADDLWHCLSAKLTSPPSGAAPYPPASATHEASTIWTRTCCDSQTGVTQRSLPDDDHRFPGPRV